MTEPYKPKKFEIAGFELCGWKLDNGDVVLGPSCLGDRTVVPAFPEQVDVLGVVYTLETVEWQSNGFGWGTYA